MILKYFNSIFVLDNSTNTADISTNINKHNLTIYMDCDATIIIENATGYSEIKDLKNVELVYSNLIYFQDCVDTHNSETFLVDDGCFEITFSSTNLNSQSSYHSECIVYLNNDIVGYCGVYDSTEYSIICVANQACQYSFVLGAQILYRITGDSCARNVDNVYIMEEQTDMVIYSGNLGGNRLNLTFKAPYSGNDITIYCETNDKCSGKCLITCNNSNNTIGCPQIVLSVSPSVSPTMAPVKSYELLTEDEVSDTLNWLLV